MQGACAVSQRIIATLDGSKSCAEVIVGGGKATKVLIAMHRAVANLVTSATAPPTTSTTVTTAPTTAWTTTALTTVATAPTTAWTTTASTSPMTTSSGKTSGSRTPLHKISHARDVFANFFRIISSNNLNPLHDKIANVARPHFLRTVVL